VVLSSPLDELGQRYPQVRLRISANWTMHLIEEVRSGALDCAIALIDGQTHLRAGVTATALGTEELVVVAAKSLSLQAARRPLRLQDLAGNGWILNPSGCGYRAAVQRAYDREGLALDMTAEVFGHDLQLSLVARGTGFTVTPRSKFETSAHRRGFKILRIRDLELETTVALLHGGPLGNLESLVDWLQGRMVEQLQI
jgi:DNA-binding transcriptional LysR family regulator